MKEINLWLKGQGLNPFNQPLFRVVFSDMQFEKRNGIFNEFYNDIFLREVRGIREVPKYPYILHRWILERWIPPELSFDKDLPDSRQGSYEPIFVFEDKFGNELPVAKRPIELILAHIEKPRFDERKSELKQADENKVQAETNSIMETLDG